MSQRTDLVFECEDILNLIPEYAFGLTDPEQAQWIEANIARCPEAVAQLEDYRRLQDEMRMSVPEIEPPQQAGARLMMALARESAPVAAPVAAPVHSMTVRPPASDPHISTSPPLAAPVSAIVAKAPRRAIRIAWLAGAAAIAAVLALIITNVYWL
ncbi:MAG: hypothetical protein ABI700_30785, partial [Chloroflexota bacterium]